MKKIRYLLFFILIGICYYFLGPYKIINPNEETFKGNISLYNVLQQKLYIQRFKIFNNQILFDSLYTLPFYQKTNQANKTSEEVFNIRLLRNPDFDLVNKVIIKETYVQLNSNELTFVNNFNFNNNLNYLQKINVYCFYWKTKSQNISLNRFLNINSNFSDECKKYDSNNNFKQPYILSYYDKFITSPVLFSIIINLIFLFFIVSLKNKKIVYQNLIFCLLAYNFFFIINNFF